MAAVVVGTQLKKIPHPFGVDLKEALQATCHFLDQCIDYLTDKGLNEVGLFRLCGSQSEIQQLKEKIMEEPLSFTFQGDVVHSVTGLLKLWFRELPDPIMKSELYEVWLAPTVYGEDDIQRDTAIANVLKFLKSENKYILGRLCHFLAKVQQNKAVNQMDARNLALCFAPNLLRPKVEEGGTRMVSDSDKITNLVRTLILKPDFFFGDVEALNPFPKVFILKFDNGEKKIPLRNAPPLRSLVERICLALNKGISDVSVVDVNGNPVDMETDLKNIPGNYVRIKKNEPKVTPQGNFRREFTTHTVSPDVQRGTLMLRNHVSQLQLSDGVSNARTGLASSAGLRHNRGTMEVKLSALSTLQSPSSPTLLESTSHRPASSSTGDRQSSPKSKRLTDKDKKKEKLNIGKRPTNHDKPALLSPTRSKKTTRQTGVKAQGGGQDGEHDNPLLNSESDGLSQTAFNEVTSLEILNDPQLPIQDTSNDPQLPTQEISNDPQLPIQGNSNDPQLPIQGNSNDPQLPIQGNSNDPQLPQGNSNDPQLPQGNSNDPQLPQGNSNDPQLPIQENSNDPQLPTQDNSNDPQTPIQDNSNDPLLPIQQSMDNHDRRDSVLHKAQTILDDHEEMNNSLYQLDPIKTSTSLSPTLPTDYFTIKLPFNSILKKEEILKDLIELFCNKYKKNLTSVEARDIHSHHLIHDWESTPLGDVPGGGFYLTERM